MKTSYQLLLFPLPVFLLISGIACGQKEPAGSTGKRVKTITIVNGDTTITESNISENEFAWTDNNKKDSKNVKVMKIISSDGDTAEINEIETKIKTIMDEKGNGEKMHKKIIMIDENGNTKTIQTENSFSYDFNIDNKGKKKVIIIDDEEDMPKDGKRIVKKVGSHNEGDALPVKNININVDEKKQTIKLELESEKEDAINVVVMDEQGKQVFYDSQKNGKKYEKEIKLDKKGVYFLSIIQNKKVMNERIVIE